MIGIIYQSLFQHSLEKRGHSPGAKNIWMDSVIPVEYRLFPESVKVINKSDSGRATIVF